MNNSIVKISRLRKSIKTYESLRKSGKTFDWTFLPKDIKVLLFDKYLGSISDYLALRSTCTSFFKASKQSLTGHFLLNFDFHQNIIIFK